MAFEKLKAMKCWPEVDQKVRAGIAIENIAEWVQEERGEYLDAKRDSLIRALYRYKQSLPATQLAIPEPLHIHKKIEKLKRGLRELEEMEKLYLLQLSRISMATELEDKMRFPNSKLWKDVELAQNILLNMAKLKMEMGLYERVPGQVHVTGAIEHTHKEFLDSIDPEQRQKLSGVAHGLLEKVKEMLSTTPESAPEPARLLSRGDDIVDADYEVLEAS